MFQKGPLCLCLNFHRVSFAFTVIVLHLLQLSPQRTSSVLHSCTSGIREALQIQERTGLAALKGQTSPCVLRAGKLLQDGSTLYWSQTMGTIHLWDRHSNDTEMSSSLHEGMETQCFSCACLAPDCLKDSGLKCHDSSDFGTMHFQEHSKYNTQQVQSWFWAGVCVCACVVLAKKIDNHFMTEWIIDPGSLSFLWPFFGGCFTVLSGPYNG